MHAMSPSSNMGARKQKRSALESSVQSTLEDHARIKAQVVEETTKFIFERSKDSSKQAAVDEYVQRFAEAQQIRQKGQRTQQEHERLVQEQAIVAETTSRRVEFEQNKLRAAQKVKDDAQVKLDEMEAKFDRLHQAVHEADRIAEKELLRVRRAKEICSIEEARASEAERAVGPLRRPVETLEDDYMRMESALEEYDERCEESRQALMEAVDR
jgi:hypothetical protein